MTAGVVNEIGCCAGTTGTGGGEAAGHGIAVGAGSTDGACEGFGLGDEGSGGRGAGEGVGDGAMAAVAALGLSNRYAAAARAAIVMLSTLRTPVRGRLVVTLHQRMHHYRRSDLEDMLYEFG